MINGLEKWIRVVLSCWDVHLFMQDSAKTHSLPCPDNPAWNGFQGFNLFPHKTVLENLMLAPRLHNLDNPNDLYKRSPPCLIKLACWNTLRNTPNLSGGQQQRVAIARTLVMKPAVVLLMSQPRHSIRSESAKYYR
nr:Arginine transport ATP-binding protein ArtM [Klebsiella pneumoniae]